MLINLQSLNIDVLITDNVIETLVKFIQNNLKDKEAGGILTGKIFSDRIEITSCSTPSNLDTQKRFNFVRSYKSAQKFIDKVFQHSKGKEIYLGEWHTHPEHIPTPSNTDLQSFKQTITKNKLNSSIHFMIIVGIKQIYIGTYVKGKLLTEDYFNSNTFSFS